MTVSSTDSKVVYTGSGVGPYDFTFRIFASTDLVVTKYTIATGAETVLALTTDYSVTIDGTAGGSVLLVVSATSDYKVIIQRVLPLTQTADYVANDPFPAETHEAVADRAVMLSQQLKEEVDRSLKVDATQTGVSLILPIPAASQIIGWNSGATALENYDIAESDVLVKSTQAEAQAGTENTHFMTPLRTAEAITAQARSPRVTSVASSATPSVDVDSYDALSVTALATAITSLTISGTPVNFQKLLVRIKDDGTARAIALGASCEAKGVALPTTTVISKVLTIGLIYDSVTSKWGCVATAQEA